MQPDPYANLMSQMAQTYVPEAAASAPSSPAAPAPIPAPGTSVPYGNLMAQMAQTYVPDAPPSGVNPYVWDQMGPLLAGGAGATVGSVVALKHALLPRNSATLNTRAAFRAAAPYAKLQTTGKGVPSPFTEPTFNPSQVAINAAMPDASAGEPHFNFPSFGTPTALPAVQDTAQPEAISNYAKKFLPPDAATLADNMQHAQQLSAEYGTNMSRLRSAEPSARVVDVNGSPLATTGSPAALREIAAYNAARAPLPEIAAPVEPAAAAPLSAYAQNAQRAKQAYTTAAAEPWNELPSASYWRNMADPAGAAGRAAGALESMYPNPLVRGIARVGSAIPRFITPVVGGALGGLSAANLPGDIEGKHYGQAAIDALATAGGLGSMAFDGPIIAALGLGAGGLEAMKAMYNYQNQPGVPTVYQGVHQP